MFKKIGILAICVLAIFCFLATYTTFAASDDFLIRTIIGEDTAAPTTPGDFTATPIATSQINLSWSSSTDDFILSGYHIWRDNVQVATTSGLTYEDVGLSASTTYSYYVTAFDSFFNESASSTVESTTTLSIPPTPASTSSGTFFGSRITPFDRMLTSIEILPQKDSVIIRYVTDAHLHSIIKWGKTSSYELGSLAERAFETIHETRIVGLLPGTEYRFVIEGENKLNRYGTVYEGSFTTLALEDIFAPGNITDFTAEKNGTDILLSWTNPKDIDFNKVRILESEHFYPSDVADGWVVYEGEGETALSRGKALPGTTHYYTIFAYDTLGNISSGAVAVLTVSPVGVVSTSTTILPIPVASSSPESPQFTFMFEDLRFSQEGELIGVRDGTVFVDGSKQLTITIPYGDLPEHLKTILVVLGSNEDSSKQFSFLLRINQAKTEYIAILAPLGVSGEFPIQVSIFDYKTAHIAYTDGIIISKIQSLHPDSPSESFGTYVMNFIFRISHSYIFWFVLALVVFAYMGRRLIHRQF